MSRTFSVALRDFFGSRSVFGTPRTRRADRRSRGWIRRRLRLEALEQRALLSATVATDKWDYAPGETALVNGSGFAPGETVQLEVLLTDGTRALGNNPWQVADGDNSFSAPYLDARCIWHYPDLDGQVDGNLQTTWFVNPADETNATMQLTATGLSSGELAQTTFTDSASITNVGTATDTDSNNNSLTVTLPSAIAVGNTVIVTVALKTTDAGTVSVTDAAGGTYHMDANITNASGIRLVVLSAPVTTALSAGSSITVTTPTNISDKAVQVSKANAAFEAATTSTGSDGYPTSSAVTASVS